MGDRAFFVLYILVLDQASRRNRNGLNICMRRPLPGELLGLAVLTKALALWRLPVARR